MFEYDDKNIGVWIKPDKITIVYCNTIDERYRGIRATNLTVGKAYNIYCYSFHAEDICYFMIVDDTGNFVAYISDIFDTNMAVRNNTIDNILS